jgi:hypothetical protein
MGSWALLCYNRGNREHARFWRPLVNVDPHAWLLTLPLTIALVQLARRPADCVVRRWWGTMIELESEMWFRLRRGMCEYNSAATARTWRCVHAFAIAAFSAASIASFASFIAGA